MFKKLSALFGGKKNLETDLKKDERIGGIIKYGRYWINEGDLGDKEDIEWLVLDTEGNKLLLLSKYGIDSKKYNKTNSNISWETCYLRSWLNEDFYNIAFNDSEKAKIQTTTVKTDNIETSDKLFLLSSDEVQKYMPYELQRLCDSTFYARYQGARKKKDFGNGCSWSLRASRDTAREVNADGGIGVEHTLANFPGICVRPVMWVEIEPI